MITRLPIRHRLTAAFAVAMAALLLIGGILIYLVVRGELTEALESSLVARAETIGALADQRAPLPATTLDPEEGFAQVIDANGTLTARTGGPATPVLDGERLETAEAGPVLFEDRVAGVEGTALVLAQPAAAGRATPIVVVGESLEDREETLAGLLSKLAIVGPIAIAIASAAGYLLTAAGLRPVEAMRRRAEALSLEHGELLPLPASEDEIRRLGLTLNEMLTRLRASFERERRFVADASHELRTPLAVLKAEIEAALRAEDLPAEIESRLPPPCWSARTSPTWLRICSCSRGRASRGSRSRRTVWS